MAYQRFTDRNTIPILESVTAANGAPSTATDGVSLANWNADDGTLVFQVTATTGTRTLSGIVWLYYEGGQDNVTMGVWAPRGTSTTPANRGMLNEETDVTNASANFNHAERVTGLRDASRIYIEIDADPDAGGTGGNIEAWLTRRGGQR